MLRDSAYPAHGFINPYPALSRPLRQTSPSGMDLEYPNKVGCGGFCFQQSLTSPPFRS